MSPASADTTSPPSPASAMSNFWTVKKKLVALTSLMRHMAGREDQFTEQQARTVEVFAVRADKLSAKAKVPHSAR